VLTYPHTRLNARSVYMGRLTYAAFICQDFILLACELNGMN